VSKPSRTAWRSSRRSFGIFAVGCFLSTDHFHEFVTGRLARVAGVRRAVTSNITRIVKREHTFPIRKETR
jgi:hypothetical protein